MMKKISLFICAAMLTACSSPPASAPAAAAGAPTGRIPITTKSPEALAHYQRGETLLENLRTTEAVEEFNQALTLDPDFASARSLKGASTPGPGGLKDMEAASAAATNLPEAERLLIEGGAA